MRFAIPFFVLLLSTSEAQTDEFRVYTEHPRLILTAQRLRLLKRERERESQRWRQFDLLVKGTALPEPAFALALYYAVSGDEGAGKRAVAWALGPADDLRQLALVYDWCQPILTAQQSGALSGKIRQLVQKRTADTISARRDRVLALIATADDPKHSEEAPLGEIVQKGWRAGFAPALADGRIAPSLSDIYALLEMLHAIRDNLKIDLRDDALDYFAHLPTLLIAGNYPAPYRAPENEFRIPVYQGDGQPDLNRAALARAAGLSMVAFDNNGLENQFLQGWLIQDRFLMMSPFGTPYEFLWANPYQPGLSYYQLPLVFHDPNSGALFVRSAWDEDADWFGLYAGEAELFRNGHVMVVNQGVSGSSTPKPLQLGDASVIFGRTPFQFSMEGGTILVIGLKPRQKYLVETDDEEMREISTDRAGTFVVQYPPGRTAGVRVHEESLVSETSSP
ncbi:MAG: hypothetical protein ABSG13_08395 [Bryobacteraceae bacterium]|jgi:hypothetical protein